MKPRITLITNGKKIARTHKVSSVSYTMPSLFESGSDTAGSGNGFATVIELSPKLLKISGGFRRVKTV